MTTDTLLATIENRANIMTDVSSNDSRAVPCGGCGKPVDTSGEFDIGVILHSGCEAPDVAALRAERDRAVDECDKARKQSDINGFDLVVTRRELAEAQERNRVLRARCDELEGERAWMRERLIRVHEYTACAHCSKLIDFDGSYACQDRDCWGCGAIGSENEHECDGVPDHCPGCHDAATKAKDDDIAEYLDHIAETTGEIPLDWRRAASERPARCSDEDCRHVGKAGLDCDCAAANEQDEVTGWKPGDPCGSCGSNATTWQPDTGASCGGCGRTDADE